MPLFFPPAFRPMKGEPLDLEPHARHGIYSLDLKRELLYSVKMDGVRILLQDLEQPCYSARLLPIRNRYINKVLRALPPGLEGECMLADSAGRWLPINKVNSACNSFDGEPNFHLFLFDIWSLPHLPYAQRYNTLLENCPNWKSRGLPVSVIPHIRAESHEQLVCAEHESHSSGFEGLMVRGAQSLYKYGRSTFAEHGLLKLKRYADCEGVAVGFTELQRNHNEPSNNELGLQHRSGSQQGLLPGGTLGSVIVRAPQWGKEFQVGSGFTQEERDEIWNNKEKYYGQQLTFKYQQIGTLEVPRQPIFKCWRPGNL